MRVDKRLKMCVKNLAEKITNIQMQTPLLPHDVRTNLKEDARVHFQYPDVCYCMINRVRRSKQLFEIYDYIVEKKKYAR
jgi:hypothetical protein